MFVFHPCKNEEAPDDKKQHVTKCEPSEAEFFGVYERGENGLLVWQFDCYDQESAKNAIALLNK